MTGLDLVSVVRADYRTRSGVSVVREDYRTRSGVCG